MPSDKNARTLQELKVKIKTLEAENARLTEQSEDHLLLGLVSESICGMDSQEGILAYTLEQIALSKHLPFCAFCELLDHEVVLRH